MKRINFQTTFLSMITIPMISTVNVWLAYLYIFIFMVSIGWERKQIDGKREK